MSNFPELATRLIVTTCILLGSITTIWAEETILTIEGKTINGKAKHYTLEKIETFKVHTIKTHTPWHDGLTEFQGVLLSDLLKDVGNQGETIRVIALNDYSALIPVTDTGRYSPILAYKLNGSYMSIEDKGPLFVIYPFDDNPELQEEIYHSRSVWQVRTIIIK